ncbi:hypothetical protein JCM17844_06120 [Iodidimonas gelatinilytica]|uniref:Tetratricopeptide repeat protein n=1 Tax=Iodidimonas gelatinilytica TaxID=1236966 RepID=A0A5A7MYF9_9PROT|nr:hypothetical protein JCM17844_06120 [Iodidimonas gelatinilytica]GER00475.1 hypothetical protein JCM17845_10980 [Iodidimonas gelatinilytica]
MKKVNKFVRIIGFLGLLFWFSIGAGEAQEAGEQEQNGQDQEQTNPDAPQTAETTDFVEAYAAGKFDLAARLAQQGIDGGDLPRDRRGRAYLAVGKAHVLANRFDHAREALDQALALLDAPAEAHYERFKLAYMDRDWVTAARDLKALAEQRPDLARPVHLSAVQAIQYGALGMGEDALVFDLLIALRNARYSGAPNDARPDRLYRDLVQMLGERGRLFEAEALIDLIHDVDLMAGMMVDRRFAPLWRVLDTKFGTSASSLTIRELEFINRTRQNNRSSLGMVRQHMKDLRRHGLPQQAAQLGGAVMNSVESGAIGQVGGSDLLWVANELAYALLDMEEVDAAISLLGQLAGLDPKQVPGLVNQQINYAGILMGLGRFESALNAAPLAEMGAVSRYGQFFIRQIAVCSYEALGEHEKALAALGPLQDQPLINPRATQIALLCLDRTDEGADQLVRRLENERTREDALLALLKPDLSFVQEPFFLVLQDRFDALRKNPKVISARDKVGRDLSLSLRPIYWAAF